MPKEKRVDEFGAMGSYNGRIAFNAMHKKYIITEVLSFPRYVFYNALGLAKIRANLQMSVVGMIPVDYNDALNIPVDTCRFGGRLAKVNDGMCQPPPPVAARIRACLFKCTGTTVTWAWLIRQYDALSIKDIA